MLFDLENMRFILIVIIHLFSENINIFILNEGLINKRTEFSNKDMKFCILAM